MLLTGCVVVKVCLLVFCKFVEKRGGSHMVRALSTDHLGDCGTNLMVAGVVRFTGFVEDRGWDKTSCKKLDAAVNMVLSLYMVYGWLSQAFEQAVLLSDRRADDTDIDVEALNAAVQAGIKDEPVQVSRSSIYNSGDCCNVRLELTPSTTNAPVHQVAKLLQAIDSAVHGVSSSINMVETRLRPRFCGEANKDFSWVQEYDAL